MTLQNPLSKCERALEISDMKLEMVKRVSQIISPKFQVYMEISAKGKRVKIFDNEDFGYYRITVERPLRLNFLVNDERIEQVKVTKAFANLATSKKRKDKKAAQKEIEAGKSFRPKYWRCLKSLNQSA